MARTKTDEYGQVFQLLEDGPEQEIFNHPVNEAKELKEYFNDPYQTEEQKRRDGIITDLLSEYVDTYKKKAKSNRHIKNVILYFSLFVLFLFISASCAALFLYVRSESDDWQGLAAVISAFLTCAGLLIGVMKIIANYAFPLKEEEYITNIVQTIQRNDLANKRVSIEANNGNTRKK